MVNKKESINQSNFFQDLAISLKSERQGKDKANNIIKFIDEELDLERWGVELCREQKIPLKIFYGVELDGEDKEILRQWQFDKKTTWDILDPPKNHQGLILEGGRRGGKCCDLYHTKVFTDQGIYYLDELKGNTFKGETKNLEMTTSSGTNITSKVTYFYNNGVDRVKKITTKLGYSLASTKDHRIKVLGESGNIEWRYVFDLNEGDYVALSKYPGIWSSHYYSIPDPIKSDRVKRKNPNIPFVLTEAFGYLLGVIVGDGSWNYNNVRITGEIKDLESYVSLLSDVLSEEDYKIRYNFNDLGYKAYDKNSKSVPNCILKSPKSVVSQFLRGLFDTDGFISKDGKHIEFYSGCRQLTEEVQSLLLNFGIVASINQNQVKGYENDYYTLRLIGLENCHTFAREIGFGLFKKAKRLSILIKQGKEEEEDDYLYIPYQKAWCRYLRDCLPISRKKVIGKEPNGFKNRKKSDRVYKKELKHILGNVTNSNSGEELSYSRLYKLLRWMEDTGYKDEMPKIYSHFRQFEDTDYFYDRIVNFEEYEVETGDLVVPEGHTYTANGIISHNSTISSLIIGYEFYKLVMLDCPQLKYGIARNSPISILAIATTATQTERTIFKQVRGVIPLVRSLNRMVERGEIFIGKKAITHEEKMVYVYPGNSESSGQVGQNVICLVMDEVARFANDTEGNSNAETIWSNIGLSGMTFGSDAKRIALSSAWEPGDAIEKLYKVAEDEESFVGFRLKSWDINPKMASRDNPVVKAEYSLNPLRAALEFEGKRLAPANRFLDKEAIRESFKGTSRVRYIDVESEDRLIRKKVTKVTSADYFSVAHIDPGIVKDSYALAIGHSEENPEGQRIVVIDCLMAWQPQPGYQVSVTNVQEAILDIHGKRPIRKLTSDHHQNTETVQRLNKLGINAEGKFFGNKFQLMIYEQLRFLLNEGRIILPRDSPVKDLARDELNQLELVNATKIDHPRGGCFAGETKVVLADNSVVEIHSLVDKEVEVQSCSHGGEWVIGSAKGLFSGLVSKVIDIVFETGTKVTCTLNHRFMTKTGNYIEALHLTSETLLMASFKEGYPYGVRVVSKTIRFLDNPILVYDLSVRWWNNFALANGSFVHNSKDLADAIASVSWHLTGNESGDECPRVISSKRKKINKDDSLFNDDIESSFLRKGKARLDYFQKRKLDGGYFG